MHPRSLGESPTALRALREHTVLPTGGRVDVAHRADPAMRLTNPCLGDAERTANDRGNLATDFHRPGSRIGGRNRPDSDDDHDGQSNGHEIWSRYLLEHSLPSDAAVSLGVSCT